MLAHEIMQKDVFTIQDDQTVDELVDLLVREHIQGAPVVDRDGNLVGVVTQQDVFFSTVTLDAKSGSVARPDERVVAEVMTSPAVSATENTEVAGLCRMMHRLRIHRVPILKNGKVTGIISSLDIVGALADGRLGA